MGSLAVIEEQVASLRREVVDLSPEAVSGSDAARLVEIGVAIERLGASIRTRFALRVTRTAAYEGSGHKHAAGWLAEVSGESVNQAQGALAIAAHLAQAPVVDRAFEAGQLSLSQAKAAAVAGVMDPSAQQQLVDAASRGQLNELAARIRRKKEGERSLVEREARAHRGRYLRIWSPAQGGIRLDAWLPSVDGARVRSVLDQEADQVFVEARQAGIREPANRYLADALVRVVTGEATSHPTAQVAVRVDAGALRRGYVEGDEVCEIPGVGPVPVATARDLMSDAFFHVVVAEGVDVTTVSSKKRTIPAALRRALMERDRTCAVPGCNATRHLEIDHRWDFAKGGPTELGNLHLLCRPHHRMKTVAGFRLLGPPGDLRWVPPEPSGRRPAVP